MPRDLPIDDFLALADSSVPVVDVRSPSEHQQGRLPDSINVPLFDDKQRAAVGTCYKKHGHDEAVLLGLEIAGKKMRQLAESLISASGNSRQGNSRQIAMHCWRGGMRSQSMAWLAEQAGLRVSLLSGGYKSYRRAALESFAQPRKILVLSGLTGSGKTCKLHGLRDAGQQILDLEGLANHRGSSFGAIGLPPQPTCEQFQNDIFETFRHSDPERIIWIEDESPSIGKVRVPEALWKNMRHSPAIFLELDREQRARNLVQEYGELQWAGLLEATERLKKRLGGLRTSQLMDQLNDGQIYEVALDLLEYYDRTYFHAASRMPRQYTHKLGDVSIDELIAYAARLEPNCLAHG